MNDNQFNYYTGVIGYPILFFLIIWIVFWLEFKFNFDLKYLGILPREISGLRGVLFSPFIHLNLQHLISNSLPLLILSSCIFYFYRKIVWNIIFLGIIISGIITWLIGRDSLHIGASGFIYVLFSFIFFKGIITKNYNLIAVSLAIVFVYGSMLWYIIPVNDSISWEGHLSGFITGIILSLLFNKNIPKMKSYDWEKEDYKYENDPFLSQFDKDGNFIDKNEL